LTIYCVDLKFVSLSIKSQIIYIKIKIRTRTTRFVQLKSILLHLLDVSAGDIKTQLSGLFHNLYINFQSKQ